MPWETKKTMDGLDFYYNTDTREISLDKPPAMRTVSEANPGNWTWAPHPKDYWVPAKIVSENDDGTVELKTDSGDTISVPKNRKMEDVHTAGRVQEVPLWPLKKSELKRLEPDLIMLENVNDGSIIHNLKQNYAQASLYTWVGASHRVLISINPYQRLPLYGSDQIKLHREKSMNVPVPPHVFDIADGAYDEMLFSGKHQSILISGESGAGKTEAFKQCLLYWSKVAGSKNGVENRLIQANPILEAFGNAKTIRNNNSSRFGKWVEVYYDQLARSIDGAIIVNYLLEKSRLVALSNGERNFHVFYHLLSDSSMKSKYELKSITDNRYTQKGITTPIQGIDDVQDFKDCLKAIQDLGFSNEESEWLQRIPAAILHLGNITFNDKQLAGNVRGSVVADDDPLQKAAKYLDLDMERLRKVLLSRSISVNRETSVIALDADGARASCDSIAKGVYSRVFDYLITRCNTALRGDSKGEFHGKFIGVLDIFGFEIFEINSFEQLCINFCNEKLQQLFNIETFKDEEELYKQEGIKFDPIVYADSDPVLQMIEKGPKGILPLLDDECKLPEGSDSKFMNKVEDAHNSHPKFTVDVKLRNLNRLAFSIIHYAGTVQYKADEFSAKNKDTFFQDAYDTMQSSSHPLTKAIFPTQDTRVQIKSLSTVFRSQLATLMQKLNETSTRYIRCIKPNESMAPLLFEAPLVMRQLRYSGVFEAVAIRKQGYPFRWTYEGFAFRYKTINPDHQYSNATGKALCEEIISTCPTPLEVCYGKTKIFYRAQTYLYLQLLRNLALEVIIPRVQGILRGAMSRVIYKRIKQVETQMQSAMDARNDYDAIKSAVKSCDDILGTLGSRVYREYRPRNEQEGKQHLANLQLWVDEENKMEQVLETDPNKNYPAYWAQRERCNAIKHIPMSSRQQELYSKLDDSINNCEVGKLDNRCVAARKIMIRADLEACLATAREYNHSSPPVDEVKRVLALDEKSWLELEVVAATNAGDGKRAKACKMRLWEIEFAHLPSSYERWYEWRGMNSPDEYSKGLWFGKKACRDGMFMASTTVVNASLVKPSGGPEFKKLAKEINKNVLVWCGLKTDGRGADAAAVEAIQLASRSDEGKMELFLQCMKAATPNHTKPNIPPDSHAKAYDLLGICMWYFVPPEPELFKYCFAFAIKKAKKYSGAASHGKFDSEGALPRVGSDITKALNAINSTDEGGRQVAMS
jgi:myosin heavy subunit